MSHTVVDLQALIDANETFRENDPVHDTWVAKVCLFLLNINEHTLAHTFGLLLNPRAIIPEVLTAVNAVIDHLFSRMLVSVDSDAVMHLFNADIPRLATTEYQRHFSTFHRKVFECYIATDAGFVRCRDPDDSVLTHARRLNAEIMTALIRSILA